jgi:uncharacterized protein (TIGR02001 family)
MVVLVISRAAPAAAQTAASVTILSDDRFRGHSLSRERPVALLDISHDDASGIYLDGSATAVLASGAHPELLGVQGNIGYSRHLGTGPFLDLGISVAHYTEYFSGDRDVDYADLYVGLVTGHLSSHVHYSPNYLGRGASAIYTDVDGAIPLTDSWRLNGHVGLLVPIEPRREQQAVRAQLDTSLGLSRRMRNFELSLAWTMADPDFDNYAGRAHGPQAFVVGLTWTL